MLKEVLNNRKLCYKQYVLVHNRASVDDCVRILTNPILNKGEEAPAYEKSTQTLRTQHGIITFVLNTEQLKGSGANEFNLHADHAWLENANDRELNEYHVYKSRRFGGDNGPLGG